MNNKKLLKSSLVYLSFLVLALCFYGLALRYNVIPMGWDQRFHFNRLEELRYTLAHHHLFPTNGLHSFLNFGLAINSFYPYLFLYPIALLQLFISPLTGYLLAMTAYIYLGLCISYWCMRKLTLSKFQSYIFTILYNTCGYLSLQLFLRADFGEYLALTFLPIAFLGTKELISCKTKPNWLLLPIGVTLIAYSHILSIFILSTVLLLELCLLCKNINKRVLLRLIASVFLFILLTLPMTFNLVTLRMHNAVLIPPSWSLELRALDPSTLFSTSLANKLPFKLDDVNIGFVAILVVSLLLFKFKSLARTAKYHFYFALFFILISTSLIPWFILKHTPINVIQFPWRFLGPASFYLFLAFSESLNNKLDKIYIIALSLFMLTVTLTLTSAHRYMEVANRNSPYGLTGYDIATNKNYHWLATTATYKDYMPKHAVPYYSDLKQHIAIINGKRFKLKTSNYLINYNSIQIKIRGLKPNHINLIDLPILKYSYDKSYRESYRGTIQFKITPKKSAVLLKYTQNTPTPPLWTLILSIGTLVIIINNLLPAYTKHFRN